MKWESCTSLIGLDEAGVGPAFGSMWASAVYIPEGVHIDGLADSKRLTAGRRLRIRERILETCFFGMGEVTSDEIDSFGLAECRRLVFERALDDFFAKHSSLDVSMLVIDGTIFRSYRSIPHTCLPKADQLVPQASAASILAKTERDAQVLSLCDTMPFLHERYGIRDNKGYLSSSHIEGIRNHGYSAFHRTSYNIRQLSGSFLAGSK